MSALSRRGKGYKSLPEDPTHLEETRVVLPRDISDLGPPEPTGATPHLPFAPNGPGAAAGSSGSKCGVCPKGFRGYVFFFCSLLLLIFSVISKNTRTMCRVCGQIFHKKCVKMPKEGPHNFVCQSCGGADVRRGQLFTLVLILLFDILNITRSNCCFGSLPPPPCCSCCSCC